MYQIYLNFWIIIALFYQITQIKPSLFHVLFEKIQSAMAVMV